MSKQKTMSNYRKRKQEKGSALSGDSQPAAGGELHQIAVGRHPALTTNQGVALADNQNSLRANPRGPTLLCAMLSDISRQSPSTKAAKRF